MELAVFLGLSIITVALSVMVIGARNPVVAAICLVFTMIAISGVYALLEAHFVAVIQIIVYAGAIVVLFLFVIMLLNLDEHDCSRFGVSPVLGVTLLLSVTGIFFHVDFQSVANGHMPLLFGQDDNTFAVAVHLFQRYLWPFELASFLILLAIVASVAIAKKRFSGHES